MFLHFSEQAQFKDEPWLRTPLLPGLQCVPNPSTALPPLGYKHKHMAPVGPCGPFIWFTSRSEPQVVFPGDATSSFPFRPHRWYLILWLIYHPLGNQQLCVFLQHWLLFPDLFVHQGLREHWFIHLIVPIAPVTNLPGKEKSL